LVANTVHSQSEAAPPEVKTEQRAKPQNGSAPRKPAGKIVEKPLVKRTDEAPPVVAREPAAVTGNLATASAAEFLTEPAKHAKAAKIERCGPLIEQAARGSITTKSSAFSLWSEKQPDAHMFQSIIALDFENAIAPRAAAVLAAAPETSGCEATLVQIHPTQRSCTDIQADLNRKNATSTQLAGMALMQAGGERQLLIPSPGSGCVIVAVSLALRP
jgi:hypothetical protein